MLGAGGRTDNSRDHLVELFTSTTVERIAALRAATETMAAACAELLRGSAGNQLQLSVHAVENCVAGDVLAGIAGSGISSYMRAPTLDTNLLATVDRVAAFVIVEALLGGDGSEPPHMPDRPLTELESKVSGLLLETIAKALEAHFSLPAQGGFVVEKATDRAEPNILGRPNDTVAVARIRLDAGDRRGEILVAFPQAAIRAMRQLPARPAPRQTMEPDLHWLRQMQGEINRASVTLTAVLEEMMSPMGDVSRFSVGQVIELNATMRSRVWFECSGERLAWCHLGKSNGAYAMRVDDLVDQDQEFMDDILSG